MEDEIEDGKQLKMKPPKTCPPPLRKYGRKCGSTGIYGMSWEENQRSVEVRKHITEDATMKKTVQNCKVFFEPGKRSELV